MNSRNNTEVSVVIHKDSIEGDKFIGVCSSYEEAQSLIHKLSKTVPMYLGHDDDHKFAIKNIYLNENQYSCSQLNGNKSIIIKLGNKFTCFNPRILSIDIKKFLKSGKEVMPIRAVANADDLISPIVGYLEDEIRYYEEEVKPEYTDLIIGEQDGYITQVDYNYNEEIMFNEANNLISKFELSK